jgi:hypothetical protein
MICNPASELYGVLDSFGDNEYSDVLRVYPTHPLYEEVRESDRAKEIFLGGSERESTEDGIDFGVDSALKVISGNFDSFFETIFEHDEAHYIVQVLTLVWILREVPSFKDHGAKIIRVHQAIGAVC